MVPDDAMAPLLKVGQLISYRRQPFFPELLKSLAGEIVAFQLFGSDSKIIYSFTHFGVITERALTPTQTALKIETARPGFLGRSFYILEDDIYTIGQVDLDTPKGKIAQYIPNAKGAKERVLRKNLPKKASLGFLFRYRLDHA